jgi:hypothetical protein
LSATADPAKIAVAAVARDNPGKVMNSKSIWIAAAAVAATLSWQTASAQASSPSRAAVKAETRAAEKSGKLTPAGEAAGPTVTSPASGPTTTRAERKAATLAARKAGTLTPAGPNQKADVAIQKQEPTKTRAERKAETLDARKKGELAPAGEGPGSPKK